jgi:hypothetical protein
VPLISSKGISGRQRVHVSLPSIPTLLSRSALNQRDNCSPILVTVLLYRSFQLDIFVFFPFTSTFIHSVDAGIQDIMPSALTPEGSSDPEPAWQLQPNSCHRALSPKRSISNRARSDRRGTCGGGNASCISSAVSSQGKVRFAALWRTVNIRFRFGPFRTCSVGMEASSSSVGVVGGPCSILM